MDLFASQETAQCPLFFFLIPLAPLGLDAMAHACPRLSLYAFPPIAPGSPGQGLSTRVLPLVNSVLWANQSLVLKSNITPCRLVVDNSGQERPSISGAGDKILSLA